MSNFVSYNNATDLMTEIGNKIRALNGAYIFRGAVTFANLPAVLTQAMVGYTYNVTNDFTTDARFVEGAGKQQKAGTNVSVADLSTTSYDAVTPVGTENPHDEGWYEQSGTSPNYVYTLTEDTTVQSGKTYYAKTVTPVFKFDIVGSFADVDALESAIKDVSDMISGEFDDTEAYSTGDIVVHEGALYKFKTDHAANDPWSSTEVDEVTVAQLITAAEPDSLTTEQVNALIALLN